MKQPRKFQLITENLPEQRVLQAIFQPERERGKLETSSYLVPSAAIKGTVYTLLEFPDLPVALVLNVRGNDPTEHDEREASIRRILSDAAPPTDWQLTMADPDVDTWLWADPRIAACFNADDATNQSARNGRYERAARIGDLARSAPIDRDAIARVHPEFRELCKYVEAHCHAIQATS